MVLEITLSGRLFGIGVSQEMVKFEHLHNLGGSVSYFDHAIKQNLFSHNFLAINFS